MMSPLFGILMVLTAGATGGPLVLGILGLALAAVAVSLADRRAAAVAVLLTITGLALSDPSPSFAAVSGMSAAVYLITRHNAALTMPTVAGLVGFTLAGVAATAVALPVSWIPLLAPAIIAGVLIVAALPLLGDDRTGELRAPWSDGQQSD